MLPCAGHGQDDRGEYLLRAREDSPLSRSANARHLVKVFAREIRRGLPPDTLCNANTVPGGVVYTSEGSWGQFRIGGPVGAALL
jgi:hypothetical protein